MISLAFLAGVLAAFNPCGFVLLPAYLTSIIVGEDGDEDSWKYNARAIRFSVGMTTGFIGVFGGFALFLSSISSSIERFLPTVTVIVGLALIVIAISLILGKSLVLRKLANPNIAPNRQWLSQIGYGISFALASLSCTVGPFLAITASAISKHNLMSILTLFLTYSVGMGGVVLVLSLLVASARSGLINKLKQSQGKISSLSGYLLLLVGLYEIWYGWYEIRILHGNNSSDPIISFAISIQSKVTQWISNFGTVSLIIAVLVISTTLLLIGRRRRAANTSSG
ncbi:MAG TPA: cytochrome c biogenesis protein CcdA [archaeon]|nr:cytochrome c biogenesis protein CcdA [archaeon]